MLQAALSASHRGFCRLPRGLREIKTRILEAPIGSNSPSIRDRVSQSLPTWAEGLGSVKAAEASLEIETAKQAIAELQATIGANREIVSNEAWIRLLFAGSGSSFTDAVATALRELEFTVVDGPHPRADLLAFRDKIVLALDCKGLDGAARETNFRQTERWVKDVAATLAASPEERASDADLKRYAEQLTLLGVLTEEGSHASECRGLMVIGTFKATPLDQRAEPDFPDPVQRLIKRSEICALTGLQLALLLLHVEWMLSVVQESRNVC
jgi:hypothetical protein